MSEPTRGELAVYAVLAKTGVTGAIVPYATAIDAAFVLIPRDELPKVEVSDEDNCYSVGGVHMHRPASLDILRECVLRDVALWEHLKGKDAKRDKRRDELARELAGGIYVGLIPELRNAIDRIIEMEAAK